MNAFNYDLSGMASGKRVDAHIIVRRYSQPDLVFGRGPTQSINYSVKRFIKCMNGLLMSVWNDLVGFFYHLTFVAGFTTFRDIRF